jgi:hypothetical protein
MFHLTHPNNIDVGLRGIHQGISSSALYLEADHESSLAAYLAEFADIMGKGSLELFEQLAAAVAEKDCGADSSTVSSDYTARLSADRFDELDHPLIQLATKVESLQQSAFWNSDKAVVILSGNRQIWLEATSNPALTLRPPHGSAVGIDLVRGHFVTDELRRSTSLAGAR